MSNVERMTKSETPGRAHLRVGHSSFFPILKRERKSRAGKRCRRSIEIVPRLLDVGDHLACAAGRARRAQAFAEKNPVRDARLVVVPGTATSEVRKNLRRHKR